MPISIRWLGNAGFYLQFSTTRLMIDPYYTRVPARYVYCGRVSPNACAIREYSQACDAVLVSHAHFDHCMDAPELARLQSAAYYGSENACTIARAGGLAEAHIHCLHGGDEARIGEVGVRVISAQHPWIPGYTRGEIAATPRLPLRLQDYRMDDCFSFLLKAESGSVLVWSSTSTRHAQPADILVCRAVSSQSWYERLLSAVKPRWVIPSHWDDIFQPLSVETQPFYSPPQMRLPPIQRIDLKQFTHKVQKALRGCQVLLPQRFTEYTLN